MTYLYPFKKTSVALIAGLGLVGALSLSACKDKDALAVDDGVDRAAIDIGLLQEGGVQTQTFISPPGYQQGAQLLTYEGPGWESDKVGYRLYLDGRNVIDIFGKKTPDLVLQNVGRGEDYHAMADWGMDILKVGNSLGAGGWGVFENGEARQVGEASGYNAQVVSDTNTEAALKVTLVESQSCGGDIETLYGISAGERLTAVKVSGDCALPLAAGIVIHPDTTLMSSGGATGWQYIARFGEQTLVPDDLGMAIFYRAEDVTAVGNDADDSYIVFQAGAGAEYLMGAAWSQEAGGITNAAEFEAWLKATQARMN